MENILNLQFGRMYPEHLAPIKGMTFELCWKKSQRAKFQCLNLDDGQQQEWYEGEQPMFHGVSWMPNIGESPNEERECTLWQIIEVNAPQKYYLSPKACQGILRRATNRGKKLPPILEQALRRQSDKCGADR